MFVISIIIITTTTTTTTTIIIIIIIIIISCIIIIIIIITIHIAGPRGAPGRAALLPGLAASPICLVDFHIVFVDIVRRSKNLYGGLTIISTTYIPNNTWNK